MSLNERAVAATINFYQTKYPNLSLCKSMKVQDDFNCIDVMAYDDDTDTLMLVFVNASEEGMPEPIDYRPHRSSLEDLALQCLTGLDRTRECHVQFDDVTMAVLDGTRAFMRRRTDVLACP